MAAVIADALAVDLRLHDTGDGAQRLLELSDERLLDLTDHILWALKTESAELELLLGSKVATSMPAF